VQTISLDSPAELLASLRSQPSGIHRLLFISGSRSAGKTHWCRQLAVQAQALGLDVAGLVSPPAFEDGRKVAIDLIDLRNSEQRRLAVLSQDGDHALRVCKWAFNLETIQWGNRALDAIQSCQVLILDELGPLELLHASGFASALRLLDSRCALLACAVIRPGLTDRALQYWPWGHVLMLPSRQESA